MTSDVRPAADEARRIFSFDNSYARLPAPFQLPQRPAAVSAPKLIAFNRPLAAELGLDLEGASDQRLAAIFSGQEIAEGAQPLAMAYAGHQFGQFVPQLGDGRAILLGEVIDRNGERRDIQLKGGGQTPFSRRGDGRAALGPVLREYIVSEAMAALGIPSTRALAAVLTGDPVYRETALPGAVFTRVAASHIRVGTFQFFAVRRDVEALRTLAGYVIERHYPTLAGGDDRYLGLLEAVTAAQAGLVARWMLVGFIHGVMNTDNMTISGETIDYGPCAFMDAYDPATVFSSIDVQGRYAYANQPRIAAWNLTRFAETLLPLLDDDEDAAIARAEGMLKGFQPAYQAAFHGGLRRKLGLLTEQEGDIQLIGDLFSLMAASRADFTLTFRGLSGEIDGQAGKGATRESFVDLAAFDDWAGRWRARLESEDFDASREAMLSANPKYIPRNHQVEAAIRAAVENEDFGPFEQMLAATGKPFDEQPRMAAYALPPREDERVLQTFCGT